MKCRFILLTVLFLLTSVISAYADPIVIDKDDAHEVTSPTEFLFKDIQELIDKVKITPKFNFIFSNYTGGTITIQPFSNSKPLGPVLTIMGSTSVQLDYTDLPLNAGIAGIIVIPLAGQANFDLLVTGASEGSSISVINSSGGVVPIPSTSSSSSSGAIKFVTPNAIAIVSGSFSKNTVELINNQNQNLKCTNNPCSLTIDFIKSLNPINILSESSSVQDVLGASTPKDEPEISFSKTPKETTITYKKRLVNPSDVTNISFTGIYPAFVQSGTFPTQVSFSKTIKVQSSISSKNPLKSVKNGGVFDRKSKSCISPVSVNIKNNESSNLATSNLSCIPQKINKFEITLPPKILTMFFDPSKDDNLDTIGLGANIVLLSPQIEVFTEPYFQFGIRGGDKLLLDEAPYGVWFNYNLNLPKSELRETITIKLSSRTCLKPIECEHFCSNVGDCCEADEEGNILKVCTQDGPRCFCE